MNGSFLLAWASFRGMFPFQPAEDALLHVFMGTPRTGRGFRDGPTSRSSRLLLGPLVVLKNIPWEGRRLLW